MMEVVDRTSYEDLQTFGAEVGVVMVVFEEEIPVQAGCTLVVAAELHTLPSDEDHHTSLVLAWEAHLAWAIEAS